MHNNPLSIIRTEVLESVGDGVEEGELLGHPLEIVRVTDEDGNRFFERTVFGNIDRFDGGLIESQRTETVNGIGGKRDEVMIA